MGGQGPVQVDEPGRPEGISCGSQVRRGQRRQVAGEKFTNGRLQTQAMEDTCIIEWVDGQPFIICDPEVARNVGLASTLLVDGMRVIGYSS